MSISGATIDQGGGIATSCESSSMPPALLRQWMNNSNRSSILGAIGQDANGLHHWVSSSESSNSLPPTLPLMNNHLAGSGALDRDEGHAADLCNRSGSGMAASCVSSAHVKRIGKAVKCRLARKRKKNIQALPKKINTTVGKECGSICHVYKSKKPSSQRTQAGAIASKVEAKFLCAYVKKKRNQRTNIKSKVLDNRLINCVPPQEYSHLCWSLANLQKVCLVFDGGMEGTPPLEEPPPEAPPKSKFAATTTPEPEGGPKKSPKPTKPPLPWQSLRISEGHLWVADNKNPENGITYKPSSGDSPFIRIPRKKALEMTGLLSLEESNKFCNALWHGYMCQRESLHRGEKKKIFSNYKYCNMGVQVCRAQRGVRDASYHKDGMPVQHWDFLLEMMRRTEKALSSFVQTESLRQLNAAKALLKFKTMSSISQNIPPCKIFGGLAFGINIHLSSHIDEDYTWSVVSVHLYDHEYKPHDRVVAYFCFPRIGVAVALRPGDILVFNPTEPHAISSRCNVNDNMYCLSMYLKTGVVGLNDNNVCLTDVQVYMKDQYSSMHKNVSINTR